MEENSDQTDVTRRDFLSKLLMGGGLIVSSLVLVRHGFSFIIPKAEKKTPKKLLVGKLDELKIGEPKEFKIGNEELFLINTGNELKVLSATCTHLGCKIRWEKHKTRFFCACHKGVFSPDGKVISGPPPRKLDEYQVEVDNNFVYMWKDVKDRGVA